MFEMGAAAETMVNVGNVVEEGVGMWRLAAGTTR